jgi:hypothetical protein
MAEAQKQQELPLENETDEVQVDLEDSSPELQVVEESTEEPSKEPSENEDEDKLDGYSKKVRERIERMTWKIREAERREQAAIQYAQGLQKENKSLQERTKTVDESYLKEYDARVANEEESLKRKLAEAIASGDVDAQVSANKDLARLAVEAGELNKAKVTREQQLKAPEEPKQEAQAPKQVHPKAQAWAQKNTWFGSDDPMTLTAFSIHNDLIKQYGEQYALTDEYYTAIDQRIREAFPHKFEESAPKTTSVNTPVAGVSRSSTAKNPKRVTLTKSEVAIAKKLGVSLEAYAKQKQKQNLA